MSIESVELDWDASGSDGAPVVILGHSLGTDRSMWEPQLDVLRASHRVVRVDLRGHGASPVPEGPYTLDAMASDVLHAANRAGVDRFAYCGVSLGGIVGLWLAARHPERVRALVAANTAAKIGSAEGWRDRILAVDSLGMSRLAEAVVPRWFSPDFKTAEPAKFAHFERVVGRTSAAGYRAACAALAIADVTADLSRIVAPTLIIGGTADVSTPLVDARLLEARISGSTLVVLDGAGHLSNVDRPAAFNASVAPFLDQHRA